MNLSWKDNFHRVVKWQRSYLTSSIHVVLHVLAATNQEDFLACLDLGRNHNLRELLLHGCTFIVQTRFEAILLFIVKRYIFDYLEAVLRMQYPETNDELSLLLLVIIFYLKFVVHLLLVLNDLEKVTSIIEYLERVSDLVANDVVRDKLKWLRPLLSSECESIRLFFTLFLPSIHCLLNAAEHLAREVEHQWVCGLKTPKNSIVLLEVSQLMEGHIDALENRLPPENRMIEIIYCQRGISFQNVFLESVGLADRYCSKSNLQDGNEYIPSTVDQIQSQRLNLQVKILQTTGLGLFPMFDHLPWSSCLSTEPINVLSLLSDLPQNTLHQDHILETDLDEAFINVEVSLSYRLKNALLLVSNTQVLLFFHGQSELLYDLSSFLRFNPSSENFNVDDNVHVGHRLHFLKVIIGHLFAPYPILILLLSKVSPSVELVAQQSFQSESGPVCLSFKQVLDSPMRCLLLDQLLCYNLCILCQFSFHPVDSRIEEQLRLVLVDGREHPVLHQCVLKYQLQQASPHPQAHIAHVHLNQLLS